MNLIINKFRFKSTIVPFKSNKGFILVISTKSNSKEEIYFLMEISDRIRKHYFPNGGVMDNLHDFNPGKKGYQLRLLEKTPLLFIDLVRSLGYSVQQEVI